MSTMQRINQGLAWTVITTAILGGGVALAAAYIVVEPRLLIFASFAGLAGAYALSVARRPQVETEPATATILHQLAA